MRRQPIVIVSFIRGPTKSIGTLLFSLLLFHRGSYEIRRNLIAIVGIIIIYFFLTKIGVFKKIHVQALEMSEG